MLRLYTLLLAVLMPRFLGNPPRLYLAAASEIHLAHPSCRSMSLIGLHKKRKETESQRYLWRGAVHHQSSRAYDMEYSRAWDSAYHLATRVGHGLQDLRRGVGVQEVHWNARLSSSSRARSSGRNCTLEAALLHCRDCWGIEVCDDMATDDCADYCMSLPIDGRVTPDDHQDVRYNPHPGMQSRGILPLPLGALATKKVARTTTSAIH